MRSGYTRTRSSLPPFGCGKKRVSSRTGNSVSGRSDFPSSISISGNGGGTAIDGSSVAVRKAKCGATTDIACDSDSALLHELRRVDRDTHRLLPQHRRDVRAVPAPLEVGRRRRAGGRAEADLEMRAVIQRRVDIEAEARLAGLLLNHDEVALIVAGASADDLIDSEIEAEERHIRLHRAAEYRMLFLVRRPGRLAHAVRLERLRSVNHGGRIATQQRAAHQHDEAIAGGCSLRIAEWPILPGVKRIEVRPATR